MAIHAEYCPTCGTLVPTGYSNIPNVIALGWHCQPVGAACLTQVKITKGNN